MTEKRSMMDRYLDSRERICPNCGTTDVPVKRTRGSLVLELLLWLAGLGLAIWTVGLSLLVALTYSIWRLATRYEACRSCKQPGPIRLQSPRGKELLEKYGRHSEVA